MLTIETDAVTERGRQETHRQMHADHRQTDAVTERGRQETHTENQKDAKRQTHFDNRPIK